MNSTKLKLNQVIAIEKGTKTRTNAAVTEAYHNVQKPALFSGFDKRYTPVDEAGIRKPNEGTRAQFKAEEMLNDVSKAMSDLFDITLTKDQGNTTAFADVIVDGVVLIPRVPITYLLFLEKRLTDIHTFVKKIPSLDAAEPWKSGLNTDGLHETAPTESQSIENYEDPTVVVPATDKFPAQVQMCKKQRIVGTWKVIKTSGALPNTRIKEMSDRVEKLTRSVKLARENANMIEVETSHVGQKVFDYLFKD